MWADRRPAILRPIDTFEKAEETFKETRLSQSAELARGMQEVFGSQAAQRLVRQCNPFGTRK